MSTELTAVNPDTGELLENLGQQPSELLAEVLEAIDAQMADRKQWKDAIEAEFKRRLKERQVTRATFGDYVVEVSVRRESVWDADQLEPVMRDLVAENIVQASDLVGIIVREPVVSRSKAKTLLARLTGDAKKAVEACCAWQEKPGKLTVVHSVGLPAPDHAPAPAPVPSESPSGGDGRPQEIDHRSLFR